MLHQFVFERFEFYAILKNLFVFLSGITWGALVVVVVLAFYLANAKYEGELGTIVYTGKDPKVLTLPKTLGTSFSFMVDMFITILFHHFFRHKIKSRERVIDEKRGRRVVCTALMVCTLSFVLGVYYSAKVFMVPEGPLKVKMTESELNRIGISDDIIQKLLENDITLIKTR